MHAPREVGHGMNDHDHWWAQLPTTRKAQIRQWLSGAPELGKPIPGQLPLIDVERGEDNFKDHR